MSKTQIGVLVLVLVIIGFGAYKFVSYRNTPKIDFIGTPTIAKTEYKMCIKGNRHEGTIAFGQVQSKIVNGYTFEAISQAATNNGVATASKKIIFTIKEPSQKVLLTKTLAF